MKSRLWLAVFLCFAVGLALAQAPGDLASDSHYTLLLKNDKVRVFQLSLSPAQQVFVQHDHNFLMIMLQDSEVVIWRDGESAIQSFTFKKGDMRFYFGGHAYGIRDDRTASFSSITVEFLDPKVSTWGYQWQSGTWDYSPFGSVTPVDPQAKYMNSTRLGDIVVTNAQLLPGDSYPAPEKASAELLVPITDLDLKAANGQRIRKSLGDAIWIPGEQKSRFVNADSDPARFVVVEFPPPAQ